LARADPATDLWRVDEPWLEQARTPRRSIRDQVGRIDIVTDGEMLASYSGFASRARRRRHR
jgi:hypothetical protein